ncbi:MAG TPA: helix-turn-helix domain-containing protein [Thermoleophilaceae bacterium]|jgi:DNA-binding HxlR family transcriptional regulator|nr:helix-turn-helix domain-containing protein [Thermoleophilaceae bacterium]
MGTHRSYRQTCGVARALDLLGERWTLLVVRELLLGPKRFGTLQAALPGISTNLLSARLRSLVAAGVAEPVRLPPPAAVSAYALTERGEALRPAVEALAVWGFELLDPVAEREQGLLSRGAWLASTLAAAAASDAAAGPKAADAPDGKPVRANFDVEGDRFNVRLEGGRAQVRHGVLEAADAELRCSLPEFYALARGQEKATNPALAAVFGALAAPVGADEDDAAQAGDAAAHPLR